MRINDIITEGRIHKYKGEDFSVTKITDAEFAGFKVEYLSAWGSPIGFADFAKDGNDVEVRQVEVDPLSRGQGIASLIYDFVKSLGFTIQRSWDQTDDGKRLWDTRKGEDERVWEQDLFRQEEEIVEYDQDSTNSKQIVAKLKSLGYEMLGSGIDASVWSKDAGSVIKIIMPTDVPGNPGDSAFMAFYEFCVAHKNSPFLPKFVSISGADHSVFTLNGVDYRQISMEKLAPIPSNSFMEQMVWALSDLSTVAFIKWRDAKKQLTSPAFWKHFSGTGTEAVGTEADVINGLSNPAVEKMYAGLFAIMQQLNQFGKSRGTGWDLHTENVMHRGNVPVIIDPFLG
tara:strand:- start:1741 stop:2766 length:1026 start_codon:yes stop_codon:yes gene_type:complete